MQTDFLQTSWEWAAALLLYPGLLFATLLALVGEKSWGALRPLLIPRLYRARYKAHAFLQPIYNFIKLVGRQEPPNLGHDASGTEASGVPTTGWLTMLCTIAPVLALSLLPVPANPVLRGGRAGDVFLVLVLLLVQPLVRAVSRLNAGGVLAVGGAQSLGRLIAGSVPVLAAVAALMEVSRAHSLNVTSLLPAPETGAQTLVRVLAGAVLLVSLPWWLDAMPGVTQETAAQYAGRFLQAAALAVFWPLLVLPMPGELPWAIIITASGALFAYVAMRAIAERWVPARRKQEAASLLWATALPGAVLALVVALVSA